MTQQELKQGKEFHFDNQKWCVANESYDGGWILWSHESQKFMIWFNGALIHSSKTFKSAEKRLKKLMDNWRCEFNGVECL